MIAVDSVLLPPEPAAVRSLSAISSSEQDVSRLQNPKTSIVSSSNVENSCVRHPHVTNFELDTEKDYPELCSIKSRIEQIIAFSNYVRHLWLTTWQDKATSHLDKDSVSTYHRIADEIVDKFKLPSQFFLGHCSCGGTLFIACLGRKIRRQEALFAHGT